MKEDSEKRDREVELTEGGVRERKKSTEGEVVCAICICEFQDDEVYINLKCAKAHIFHESCIRDWLEVKQSCPICRQEVRAEAFEKSFEASFSRSFQQLRSRSENPSERELIEGARIREIRRTRRLEMLDRARLQ